MKKGGALVIGLLLVFALALIGTTAVITAIITRSTDLKISTNYKMSTQALYVAEAGTEEARARLKTDSPNLIRDDFPTQTGWAAYIGTSSNAQAKGYNSSNAMHVLVTSLQNTLNYTVQIEHKKNAANQILYWGDADKDGINERNTTTGQNIYLVTSYGTAENANKTIVVEMARFPPITTPGALYVNASTSIIGNANVNGLDQCGTAATNVPGIVSSLAPGTVGKSSNSTVTGAGGNPSITYNNPVLNVRGMIDSQKAAANYTYNKVSATDTGMSWGTPTGRATLDNPSTCSANNIVYYNTSNGTNLTDINLAGGTTGCGILLIDGNLKINGGFSWYGIVLVSGSVAYTGGGNKKVTGAMIVGGSVVADVVGGNSNIVYCSTAVNTQTAGKPLQRLSWMEKT